MESSGSDGDEAAFGSTDLDGVPSDEVIVREIEGVSLTPTEHQKIKDIVHGDRLGEVKGVDRRYLVVGAGGETGAASRRMEVYDRLDNRTDPPAIATRLEDFGLTPDQIKLWCRVFDILAGMASHIVAVIEDFDGGYTWEMGLLFAPSYQPKTWVLKRSYGDEATERAKYDNGMNASHVELLLTGERCQEWEDTADLLPAVEKIP